MITDLFQQIRSELVSLEQEYETKQQAVQDLVDKENLAHERVQVAHRQRDEVVSATAKEIKSSQETRDKFAREAEVVKGEVATLAKRKSDLMLANSKLEQDNKKFVDYEKKAWIILIAKDEELISREQSLAEKEQFKPRVQSLLPPTQE